MVTCNISPRRLILLTTDQDEKLRDISPDRDEKTNAGHTQCNLSPACVCVRACVCARVCISVFNIATAE